MDDHDSLAERFEENRTHTRAVAYRMLGSRSEADDAVQEAWAAAQPLRREWRREPGRMAHHVGLLLLAFEGVVDKLRAAKQGESSRAVVRYVKLVSPGSGPAS
jgi:hypothetical protein